MWKIKLKMRVTYIWSNRGCSVSISWKLVVIPKIPQSQDFRNTFKQNLTCIFLSVRLNLLLSVHSETPCRDSYSFFFQQCFLFYVALFFFLSNSNLGIFQTIRLQVATSIKWYFVSKIVWPTVKKNVLLKFEAEGLRFCISFEITRKFIQTEIQFLKQNAFLTSFWRFLRSTKYNRTRDSWWMSYETAAILNQNLAYIPHIIG